MPLIRLKSIDDDRLAVYRDLPRGNQVRDSGLMIAEGQLLVERLAASSCRLHSLLVDERRLGSVPAVPEEVPIYVTPAGAIEEVIGFNFHRGMLACGFRPPALSLDQAIHPLQRTAPVVACVRVQDPTNLGGILRNCAAFGAEVVIVDAQSAYPYSRRVLRVSMGAVLKLKLVESPDARADLSRLRESFGFELAAAVLDPTAEPLHQVSRPPRLALLIGNEGHGLPPEFVALCDRRWTIPMSLGTDSLNAAVSSGIFLYHLCRPEAS